MKLHLILAGVLSLVLTVQADDPITSDERSTASPDPASTAKLDPEIAKQQGVWKPIAAVLGGVRLPPPAVRAITLTISDNNYQVAVNGEEHVDKGTFELDTTTTPKRMTITSTDGPNKGKTFLAIYEMKNAVSMRVCYDLSGKEFPTEFKAPKDTSLYLAGYRKQTKKNPADANKYLRFSVDGNEVRILVDQAVYEHWQKHLVPPNPTREQQLHLERVTQLVRAAYQQGRKDARQLTTTRTTTQR